MNAPWRAAVVWRSSSSSASSCIGTSSRSGSRSGSRSAALKCAAAAAPRRFLSSAAVSASAPVPPRIVSRRALEEVLRRRSPTQSQAGDGGGGSTSSGGGSAGTNTESSWPKPMRYGFYVVCALSVPYTIGSFISTSPKLRSWLVGDRPDLESDSKFGKALVNLVREYWGEVEATPYIDLLNGKAKERSQHHKLEGEVDSQIRAQQVQIARMTHSEERVRVTLKGDGAGGGGSGSSYEVSKIASLPGDVAVDPGNVSHLVERLGLATDSIRTDVGSGNLRMALEFGTRDDDAGATNDEAADVTNDGVTTIDLTSIQGSVSTDDAAAFRTESSEGGAGAASSDKVRKMTPVYPAFHHFASTPDGGAASPSQSGSSAAMTPTDQRISQLEYDIGRLQSDLKDPTCTRDRDDMESELKVAKAELRRIKGWGWGRIRSVFSSGGR